MADTTERKRVVHYLPGTNLQGPSLPQALEGEQYPDAGTDASQAGMEKAKSELSKLFCMNLPVVSVLAEPVQKGQNPGGGEARESTESVMPLSPTGTDSRGGGQTFFPKLLKIKLVA